MRIVQRQKWVFIYTCGKCWTKLELDESDFTEKKPFESSTYTQDYANVNCPVCGRSLSNLTKIDFDRLLVPIKDDVETES